MQHKYSHAAFTSRGECRLLLFTHIKRSTEECGENYTTYSTSNTDKQSKRINIYLFFFCRSCSLRLGGQNKTQASQDSDPGMANKNKRPPRLLALHKSCLLSGPHRGPLFHHSSLPGPL